jgi:hypothetical protein
MSTPQSVIRDERTVAVENASYRWAYSLLAYALLVDVMCRALFRHEAAWDLMAMVVVGGVVATVYQTRQRTLAQGWVMKVVLLSCVAAVFAAILAMTLSWLRLF